MNYLEQGLSLGLRAGYRAMPGREQVLGALSKQAGRGSGIWEGSQVWGVWGLRGPVQAKLGPIWANSGAAHLARARPSTSLQRMVGTAVEHFPLAVGAGRHMGSGTCLTLRINRYKHYVQSTGPRN